MFTATPANGTRSTKPTATRSRTPTSFTPVRNSRFPTSDQRFSGEAMYRLTSVTVLRVVALALIVPILACKKKDEGYTEPSASTTTVPPAAPAATPIKVGEIDVGK